MTLSVTSGKKISSKFLLIRANQYFRKDRKIGDFNSVIPVNDLGFVVSISSREISFDIYSKVENQEELICAFLSKIFCNKTIGLKTSEQCHWIYKTRNVRIVEI